MDIRFLFGHFSIWRTFLLDIKNTNSFTEASGKRTLELKIVRTHSLFWLEITNSSNATIEIYKKCIFAKTHHHHNKALGVIVTAINAATIPCILDWHLEFLKCRSRCHGVLHVLYAAKPQFSPLDPPPPTLIVGSTA